MRNKLRILALALCASIALSAYGLADEKDGCKQCKEKSQMHQMMKKDDKMDMDDMFYRKVIFLFVKAEELEINDTQMEKIHALKMGLKKSLTLKEAEVDVLAMDVKEALGKEDIDMNTVSNLIDKKYEVKKQMAKEIAKACSDLRMILSKDQYKKAKDMWQKKMLKKMTKMMGDDKDDCCKDMKKCPMMGGGMKMEQKAETEHKGH